MAKFKILIGKNGTGKSTYIFQKYLESLIEIKKKCKEAKTESELKRKIELRLFIPSLRIDQTISNGRLENSLTIGNYYEEITRITTEINSIDEYSESIYTKLLKKEFLLKFIIDFENMFNTEQRENILTTFQELNAFIEKYKDYNLELDDMLCKDYLKFSEGLKIFINTIGQVRYYYDFLVENDLKKRMIVYIDEVENHLYPDSIKLLLSIINEMLSKNSEIILTTHNPITMYSLPNKSYKVIDMNIDETSSEEIKSNRYMTLDKILKEVFKIDNILKEDLRFFELVDKYLLENLEREEFHEIHCIIESKKRNDRGFYNEYKAYIDIINRYDHERNSNV